ncbi:MAG: hypothetical protein AVDCRST_MAG72-895 [uncultured Nocardioidaceae bacterium]|uniref:Serine esterase n=1 Tax=uncultured Nocardioidaceae bacterium TaxID=253824 RepID=A0A6J4LZI6_9ACTN|nr:MAG: hypothetical protein AVDCRST_MAG72-895 [uncultured Nocardioidaceae bacterium]
MEGARTARGSNERRCPAAVSSSRDVDICSRRAVLTGGLAFGLTWVVGGCQEGGEELTADAPLGGRDSGKEGGLSQGRLRFRPDAPSGTTGRTGEITLRPRPEAPQAYGYVPPAVEDGPVRLVLFLHGAGGDASRSVNALRSFADEERLLLLAPQSTGTTWDAIGGEFGADVENIDRLLAKAAAAYPVRSYTVAGFSDGGSYALSLGIGNGDVFDSVMAFSPCFSAAEIRTGRPRFFVSHGTEDEVLPIDQCSRQIVARLRQNGYVVTFEEFAGGHKNSPEIKDKAIDWLGHGARAG